MKTPPFMFYAFFFRNIILKLLENPKSGLFASTPLCFIFIMFQSLEIYILPPRLFQIHILVPIILYLGP
jgi:hypothetical protein